MPKAGAKSAQIVPHPKTRKPYKQTKRHYKTRWPWAEKFLFALRNSGNIRASCQAAGIDRKDAYKARDSSTAFAHAWKEAIDESIDVLEAIARQRAATISDVLLIFLLKAHRPELYRDTYRHEHSGVDGGPIQHELEVKGNFDHDGFARSFNLLLIGASPANAPADGAPLLLGPPHPDAEAGGLPEPSDP